MKEGLICLECGSMSFKLVTKTNEVYYGFDIEPSYVEEDPEAVILCDECGSERFVVVRLDEKEIEEIEKNVKEDEKELAIAVLDFLEKKGLKELPLLDHVVHVGFGYFKLETREDCSESVSEIKKALLNSN